MRLQADMENYRKRVDRTMNEIVRSRRADVLRAMLPVIDNLGPRHRIGRSRDRRRGGRDPGSPAYEEADGRHSERSGCEANRSGTAASIRIITKSLRRWPTPTANDGEIVDVVRAGYLLEGLVLRPSMVRVTRNPTDNEVGAD